MEAVGRLASGIAHDFSNLLTAVTGYTELLLDRLDPHDSLREVAEDIRSAAMRASALTRQLLTFSRRQEPRPAVLDLNVLVTDMERLLRRVIGEHITLMVTLAERIEVSGDRGADRTGRDEPRGQRARRHAPRRRPPRDDRARRSWSCRGQDSRRPGAGPYRSKCRTRAGHRRGDAGTAVRAILHDEGGEQGDGTRALHGAGHRASERRRGDRAQPRGRGVDLPHSPASRRGARPAHR